MTTLHDLEETGRLTIEARKRQIEEAQRVAVEAETESKARMFAAVLKCLADHVGIDESELKPLLLLDREYERGTFVAWLSVPGVDQIITTVRFGISARRMPNSDDLDVQIARPEAPFHLTWHKPTYYATLGEALVVARDIQRQTDEYARVADEEERLADERYQEHRRKEQEEKNDRVTFLASLLDEYPILEPLLKMMVVCLDCKADLQEELAEAERY